MLERRQIENRGPEQIAAMLTAAFDQFCSTKDTKDTKITRV
jgi:hypothetical protein